MARAVLLVLLLLLLGDNAAERPPDGYTEAWWQAKIAPSRVPDAVPHPASGVGLVIKHPPDGDVVRFEPGWGDVVPSVDVELSPESGRVADAIRAAPEVWGLCLSLDGAFLGCVPLAGEGSGGGLPRLSPDTRRGFHVLRAWLSCGALGVLPVRDLAFVA